MVLTATGAGDPNDDVTDCPECGEEIYFMADCCPHCGHWFVDDDRRKMRANRRNEATVAEATREMRIVKNAGAVLSAVLVICLLAWAITSLIS